MITMVTTNNKLGWEEKSKRDAPQQHNAQQQTAEVALMSITFKATHENPFWSQIKSNMENIFSSNWTDSLSWWNGETWFIIKLLGASLTSSFVRIRSDMQKNIPSIFNSFEWKFTQRKENNDKSKKKIISTKWARKKITEIDYELQDNIFHKIFKGHFSLAFLQFMKAYHLNGKKLDFFTFVICYWMFRI